MTDTTKLTDHARRLVVNLRAQADALEALPLGNGKTSATVALMYFLRDQAAQLANVLEPDPDACTWCNGTGTFVKGTHSIRVYHCRTCAGTGLSEAYV
jgi:hypothetical protein